MAVIFNEIVSCLTAGQARIVIKDTIYDMLLTGVENGYSGSACKSYTLYRTQKACELTKRNSGCKGNYKEK